MKTTSSCSPGLLSYPGITAEVIPQIDTVANKAYEAVLNCGGAFLAPEEILFPLMNKRASILSDRGVTGIVLVGDENILASATLAKVKRSLEGVFGNNIFQLPVKRDSSSKNPFGLPIVKSVASKIDLDELLTKAPNALAITSIPYSDPTNINTFNKTGTLLERSLSLLSINNRTIPTALAKEIVGSLGTIDLRISKNPLVQLFAENPGRTLVFKNIGQCAGGTSTQIVGVHQRLDFLKMSENVIYEVYDFIEPTLIMLDNGRFTPSQIRPFVVDGELFGFSLKMPESSIGEYVVKDGKSIIPKGNLRKLNDKFNSSSGKSVSLFFDRNGKFVSGTQGMEKSIILKDVEQMKLGGHGKLSCPEFIQKVALNCVPLVNDVQTRVNSYVGTTSL